MTTTMTMTTMMITTTEMNDDDDGIESDVVDDVLNVVNDDNGKIGREFG